MSSKTKYKRMTNRKSAIGKDHPLAKQHIRVGLKDRPDTIKRIPRLKMTVKNLKAVYGVEVHYLQDDTGNALFPIDWRVKCLPPPVLYTIKEKPKKYTEVDALEDPRYEGSTQLCLLDVPFDLDEEVLDVYLRAGLEDEDPDYQGACRCVSESEKKLEEINMKLQNIPFLQIKEAASAKEGVQFNGVSTYVGCFRDGRITGSRGIYTDISGARVEGPFLEGALHGENGSVSYADGRSFSGRWKGGKLNGNGVYKSKRCTREGRWLDGRMHGMGYENRKPSFRYTGMWKNDRRHGLGTMMFDASPVVKSAKIRLGDALDGRTYHEKKYAHLYDCIWNDGLAGLFGSRMHTSRRRPEGTYHYANQYMHTKRERVKSFHENETKHRNEFVSSDLKRSDEKLRDRKEKFHLAKKLYVENFKSKQTELEDRLYRVERSRKEEIRRKRNAEREAKRSKAEEDAKVFEKMRKMIMAKTKEENEGILVEKED